MPEKKRRRRGRPAGADSDRTRRDIVVAAAQVIGLSGFGSMTMSRVAAAAGISPTGLKHHFPSKSALLAAVLELRDEIDRDSLADAGGRGPWSCLHDLVDLARANTGSPTSVRLFASVTGEAWGDDHPAHGWMRSHYERVLDHLRSSLEEARRSGAIHPDAPVDRIARESVALMDGYQTQWLLDPDVDMPGLLTAYVAEVEARWSAPGADRTAPHTRGPVTSSPL